MNYEELELIIREAGKLRALRRAKERVRQLERELRGEPVQPEDIPYLPEFLRVQVGTRWADRANSALPRLHSERETHALTATDSPRSNSPVYRPPAPLQRSRLLENL